MQDGVIAENKIVELGTAIQNSDLQRKNDDAIQLDPESPYISMGMVELGDTTHCIMLCLRRTMSFRLLMIV